ncbi:M50 family metallopeptidase [Phenylobacterium soli]|uniref:RIP metalloprotease RseP n=1 Tax=Phenylobacterium soli TaxID=2170551 RepID=A0A328AKK2_9CAUL|nr:RIP metalloprotease [Phenylobacterium soli]RAK55360.1 RIP metalloprotease RseP [Phenylobacterium soli]
MIGFLHNALLYVIPFLIILGVVVTVHEGGHFLAAKWLGTAIDRFAIGFGRPLLQWQDKSGVHWRIGWLPLGGYVRFAGDENAASVPDNEDLTDLRREIVGREGEGALKRYFHFKPLWQRAIIVAAGPGANFLLAIAAFAILLMTVGETIAPPRVDAVQPGSAAQAAGFQKGDVVLQANGRRIESFSSLQRLVFLQSDTPIQFLVQRGGRQVAITATPRRGVIVDRFGHEQHLGQLGLQYKPQPGDIQFKRYGPVEAVGRGVTKTVEVVDTTLRYLGRMITGRETAEQLSGPLGMAQLSGEIAKQTAEESPNLPTLLANAAITMLELVGNISVGIGFLNLMPIPVLDGGHLLFYGYEAVARRPVAAKVQAAGYRVGLALVLGLMLFATWNDLQRLRVLTFLGGLFS